METLWQDLKYGARQLLRSPGFTIVAVLTLALGIGANTAIFSLTDQVLLQQLPVQDPDELVVLRSPGPKKGLVESDTDDAEIFTYSMFKRLRERSGEVTALAARYGVSVNVGVEGEAELARGELVSGNYFQVLGVRPALGRVLTLEDEATPGGNPVAVLSHGYWTRRFGGRSTVLNQKILVNNHPVVVVGVADERFAGVQLGWAPDVFLPMPLKPVATPDWNELDNPMAYWLAVLGRLRPDVSRAQAEAALTTYYRPFLEEDSAHMGASKHLEEFLNKRIELLPGARGRLILQRDAETPLLVLLVMVGLVLLIACANVANLMIARGAARQREIAVRLALGASRARLIRQLATEGVLLALVACGGGLLLAWWSNEVLIQVVSANLDLRGLTPSLNLRTLAFALAVTLGTTVLFGLLPAWKVTRPGLASTLKEQGGAVTSGPVHMRFRRVLVAAQVAFTLILLVEAGLFARTLYELSRQPLGVRTERLLTFSVAPSLGGYSPERSQELFDRLTEELQSLPGVTSASAGLVTAFTNSNNTSNMTIEGFEVPAEDSPRIWQNWVGPKYFSNMGTPLIAGREFDLQDMPQGSKIAIVNQEFVRRFFRDGVAVGRRVAFGSGDSVRPDIEIVGVVADSRSATVRETVKPFLYQPYSQRQGLGYITFYVRTSGPPEALASAVRARVAQLAPGIPLYQMKTLEEQISESIFTERLVTSLSLAFGLLAALLAAVGIAGVMAYSVARRTREIGIRIALGASRRDVHSLILRESALMVAGGILGGLPLAYGLARLTESLLFGATPADWLAALAAVVSMAAVALAACYLPARRAARVDPMVALRYE
ncbi:MAG: ABC transporter permease [Candidatus Acidiferrales bacterium]